MANELQMVRRDRGYRGVMQNLVQFAEDLLFEEYTIKWNISDLTEEEKQVYRRHPEAYLRRHLLDNGYPHPINGLAIHGSAEDCMIPGRDVVGRHITDGELKSIVIIR